MKAYHEALRPTGVLGIQVSMAALESAYIPLHWHNEMEILFCLNGGTTIQTEHETIRLAPKELIVFDSKVMHSIKSSKLYMFLCIHIDKMRLTEYIPDIDLYKITCKPLSEKDENIEAYHALCQIAADLTRINMSDSPTNTMASDGMTLILLSHLIRDFSVHTLPQVGTASHTSNDIIHNVISFVNDHYMESISLNDVASFAGVSREHLRRIFKQHMGRTILQYLSEVRISHASHLLLTTTEPIAEVMALSGFTNQTLFNRTFKEIYGCTPREARKDQDPFSSKHKEENPIS